MFSYFSTPHRRETYRILTLVWLSGCVLGLLLLFAGAPALALGRAAVSLSVFPLYGAACRLLPTRRSCVAISALGALLPLALAPSLRDALFFPLAAVCFPLAFRQMEDRSFRRKLTAATAAAFALLSLLSPAGLFPFAAYLAICAPRSLWEPARRAGWLCSALLWGSLLLLQLGASFSPAGVRPALIPLILLMPALCGLPPAAVPLAFFRRYCPPQRRQLLFVLFSAVLSLFGTSLFPSCLKAFLALFFLALPLLLVFAWAPEVEAVAPSPRLWALCLAPAFVAALLWGFSAAFPSSALAWGPFSHPGLWLAGISLFSLACCGFLAKRGWRRAEKRFHLALSFALLLLLYLLQAALLIKGL
ncbi:MAG: hypothetical protein PHD67_02305 [Oscillospiraceae bacterium]|nr:hypothetical protein [Oscillospiraceae bacterium]